LTALLLCYQYVTSIEGQVDKMAEGNQKLGMIGQTSLSAFGKRELQERMIKKDLSFFCFVVEQTSHSRYYTWKINTENSFWIKKSIEFILQSGLFQQWDRWAYWHRFLKLRLSGTDAMRNFNPNYIVLKNVIPIVVMPCTILLLCVVLFYC